MHLLPSLLAAGMLLAPASVRADAESDLFDLLMAWESVSICGFEMPDAVADRAYSAIDAYEADLGKTAGDIEQLREQAAWQILRQRAEMCAPDGSWRARYDELVAALAADQPAPGG
jgi:hypothetical protein